MFKANINQIKDLSSYLFLGADVHKNNHTFVALNSLQQKLGLCRTTDNKRDLKNLRKWIEKLGRNFKSQILIGLEDSTGNGERLASFLHSLGYEIYQVDPVLVAQRRKRTIHQDKSDQKDALLVAKTLIAELDHLSQVKINSKTEVAKELKGIVVDHDLLVKQQTQVKNQLHRLLYQEYGSSYKKRFKTTFSKKALNFWLKDAKEERAYVGLGPERPGLTVEPSHPKDNRGLRIRQKIKHLLLVRKQIKELRKMMEELLNFSPYKNLVSLDGCGVLSASALIGVIKDVKRFSNSSKLAKYSGLAPREASSGKTERYASCRSGLYLIKDVFGVNGILVSKARYITFHIRLNLSIEVSI